VGGKRVRKFSKRSNKKKQGIKNLYLSSLPPSLPPLPTHVHLLEEIPVHEQLELLQNDVHAPGNKLVLVSIQLFLIQPKIAVPQGGYEGLELLQLETLQETPLWREGKGRRVSEKREKRKKRREKNSLFQ
jgi:hypothetical protein